MDLKSCSISPKRWERKLKLNETTVLHCAIRRPAFPDSGKQQRMERYFARLAQLWQTRWETDLYQKACQALAHQAGDIPFQPWEATMDYQVTYWNSPLLSIRINIQEQGSVTPPTSHCIGEVWDCSSGFPCSLRSFLAMKPRQWKRALTKQLQEQAQQRLDSGESLLHPNCISTIKQIFDPSRFYLTEDGLVIFYPLYTLGSYGEGIPTFTIPIAPQVQSNKFRALSSTARR